MDGDEEGAKHDFFGDGTGNVVSPSDPGAEAFVDACSLDPGSPLAFDDGFFE